MRNQAGAHTHNDGAANGRVNDRIAEEKIHSKEGVKVFFLDLKENNRGRVLKLTEDVRGRRDTVMIPASDMREIAEAMLRICEWSERNP